MHTALPPCNILSLPVSPLCTDYADALASMASRWEAGLLSVAALGQLLAGYAALALAAVYIARTELRLPVIQYQRVSSAAAQQAADPSNPGSAQGLFAAARADAQARISRASVTQEYFPLPLNTSGMMVRGLFGRTGGTGCRGLWGSVSTCLHVMCSTLGSVHRPASTCMSVGVLHVDGVAHRPCAFPCYPHCDLLAWQDQS